MNTPEASGRSSDTEGEVVHDKAEEKHVDERKTVKESSMKTQYRQQFTCWMTGAVVDFRVDLERHANKMIIPKCPPAIRDVTRCAVLSYIETAANKRGALGTTPENILEDFEKLNGFDISLHYLETFLRPLVQNNSSPTPLSKTADFHEDVYIPPRRHLGLRRRRLHCNGAPPDCT